MGDQVRRPTGPHSAFVHALLRHLQDVGFDAAPRLLGIDERGREMLSFIDGFVPDELEPDWSDEQLTAAARLLRRYHDATAGSALTGSEEVVCHGDISPVNNVLVDGRPIALIDFDQAAPGARIGDVAYGAFLWLNLGWDGPPAQEQARRIRTWSRAYGLADRRSLLAEIEHQVHETAKRRRRDGAHEPADWWGAQLQWLERHRSSLA